MFLGMALLIINAVLVNIGFLLSYLVRYGLPFPEYSFAPFKRSFPFITIIYLLFLSLSGVYRGRFKSSWQLFQRVFLGSFVSTLFSVAFIYVFREIWLGFPTSVFALSFFFNFVLIFSFNRHILKAKRRIKKKVVVIGEGDISDIISKRDEVETRRADEIKEMIKYKDIDEIVICEKLKDKDHLNLLLYIVQKLKIGVVFSPSCYMQLLPERINGNDSFRFLCTFFGRKPEIDELLMRSIDIIVSFVALVVFTPLFLIVSLLVKLTSKGPVFYTQQRVGKDGVVFTLYKFRTMVKDAEKKLGPTWACRDDPRVTKVGKILRETRIDEFPQLFNVIKGDMSLVGPRPERAHFVKQHRALQELRLAVKPGITGLAQIRSFYNLHPQHKIKYDYLYIQRRSLLLNLYILAKTIPVIVSKKGW
jgi:exopolysaccharide biosynthesis polyprenyl glycosylphosphotransferase